MIASQGESYFMHKKEVINLVSITRSLFPVMEYSTILVPTYPGGNIGICLGSLGPSLKEPARQVPESFVGKMKYYNEDVHKASFVMPNFARKMMRGGL